MTLWYQLPLSAHSILQIIAGIMKHYFTIKAKLKAGTLAPCGSRRNFSELYSMDICIPLCLCGDINASVLFCMNVSHQNCLYI